MVFSDKFFSVLLQSFVVGNKPFGGGFFLGGLKQPQIVA
jgi:hypothetical protein